MHSNGSPRHLLNQRGRPQHGFTLVELMVALAIGIMVLGAILTTYIMTVKGLTAVANYAEIHRGGRWSADMIARDMRSVSAVSSYPSSSNIVVVIPTAFSSSGVITDSKTISYSMSKGALYRTDSSTGLTAKLATNIVQLTFTLYDRNTNVTAQPSSAKGIQVDIKLRKSLLNQIQSEDFLSARWDMRNIP